jgi:tRNA(Arg) A34 adenosine deaminase TadA
LHCLDRVVARLVQSAQSTPGVGGNGYRLAACILDKKGNMISNVKTNLSRTHPALRHYSPFPFLHAECNCILSHGLDHCSGCSLLVVRVTRHRRSRLTMSKPCSMCEQLARDVGIKKILYTDWSGTIESIQLR